MSVPSNHFRQCSRIGLARHMLQRRVQFRTRPLYTTPSISVMVMFSGRAPSERRIFTQEKGRRTGAGGNDFHLRNVLPLHLQSIQHRRPNDDRGTVLVVMKHRNFHPARAACALF